VKLQKSTHQDVDHVEHKEAQSLPQADVAVPDDHEGPEGRDHEEDDVAQERPLHAVERLDEADHAHDHRRHEHAGAEERAECQACVAAFRVAHGRDGRENIGGPVSKPVQTKCVHF